MKANIFLELMKSIDKDNITEPELLEILNKMNVLESKTNSKDNAMFHKLLEVSVRNGFHDLTAQTLKDTPVKFSNDWLKDLVYLSIKHDNKEAIKKILNEYSFEQSAYDSFMLKASAEDNPTLISTLQRFNEVSNFSYLLFSSINTSSPKTSEYIIDNFLNEIPLDKLKKIKDNLKLVAFDDEPSKIKAFKMLDNAIITSKKNHRQSLINKLKNKSKKIQRFK